MSTTEAIPADRPLRVLVAVPAFNAGDTTRGIESARALRDAAERHGRDIEIEFVYPTTSTMYDGAIRDAGFTAHQLDFAMSDDQVRAVMTADHDGTEFFPELDQAAELLEEIFAQLRAKQPDLVLYGFLPPVGVAAQTLGIPSACYSPFPADREWVSRHFLKEIPDELADGPLGHLPPHMQQRLTRALSRAITLTGFFRQPTTARAGRELGWRSRQPNLFGMLAADAQIVNDLPSFYEGQRMADYIHVAGPLFSRPADAEVPADIASHFEQGTGPKIFVAMGSSGEKRYLLDAIEAVSRLECTAVVLVPPHVATLDEARARIAGPADMLLTDAFVPAAAVNALADAAVIHGGQGTVQTAVLSGTPVVGVGMQWEQIGNIDQLVRAGSGIRIRRGQWAPDPVEAAVRRILAEPAFAAAARQLQQEFDEVDGPRNTGEILWRIATGK